MNIEIESSPKEELPTELIIESHETERFLPQEKITEDDTINYSEAGTDASGLEIVNNGDVNESTEEAIPFFRRYGIDLSLDESKSVNILSMSPRLSNVLQNNGCQTIQAFLKLSENDMSEMKQSGRVTVSEQ